MAQKKNSRVPEEGHINMTPMIDITFQLIIFFMLVSQLTNLTMVNVNLPIAPHAEPIGVKKKTENKVIVNIENSGKISFGANDYIQGKGQQLLKNLVNRLQLEAENYGVWKPNPEGNGHVSELQVLVRCDRSVDSELFLYVMFACNQIPIYKINIASKLKLNK